MHRNDNVRFMAPKFLTANSNEWVLATKVVKIPEIDRRHFRNFVNNMEEKMKHCVPFHSSNKELKQSIIQLQAGEVKSRDWSLTVTTRSVTEPRGYNRTVCWWLCLMLTRVTVTGRLPLGSRCPLALVATSACEMHKLLSIIHSC